MAGILAGCAMRVGSRDLFMRNNAALQKLSSGRSGCSSCVRPRLRYRSFNTNSLVARQQEQLQHLQRRAFSTNVAQKQQQRSSTTLLHYNTRTATPTSHPILRLLLQSLQHTLLKPRSLPLPRYISPQHFTFTLSECFGHSSFILVAASYATQDFLQLRIMAVLGSSCMLFFTYFHPHGRVLWLPLKWNVLFIAINSYRIGKVFFERYRAQELSDELKDFREEHLGVIDEVDYYNLMKIAQEEVFEEGDLVVQQGGTNAYIRIVLEGELEVLRDGTLTYVLEKGNFVSEAGLHAGLMLKNSIESCGAIVVGPPFDPTGKNNVASAKKNRVRCLRWNRGELTELLKSNKLNPNALKAVLSWDIVRKLKTQRHMLVEGRVKDPTVWTKKREEQGASRYASILHNMLQHPEDFDHLCEKLTNYRLIHHIDDRSHARALKECGWTEEEFRLGRKETVEEYDEEEIDEEVEYESGRWRKVQLYSKKVLSLL